MEVATENGTAPVAKNTNAPTPGGGGVSGLIAEVETKMSELMAWHAQQVKQFETDKADHQSNIDKQQRELENQKTQLAERAQQVDQQRIKLVELTSKLRAEESAMSREWTLVQREREAIQRQANELAELRERVDERAKSWLDTTAAELSQPLKLAETEAPEEGQGQQTGDESHDGEHHHAA